ncbi:MAG: GvpL/GvpF family gas vesicle protein [Candidatus Zixiibacteriota bacterium]
MTKEGRNAFEQLSTGFEDNEEWQVEIYADLKQIMDSISATIRGTKGERLLQAELDSKLDEYKEKSFGWMVKQAQKAQLNEVLCREPDQERQEMILSSTYLVSKDAREDFTTVVKFLGKEYENKGLVFECIGPRVPDDSVW